VKSFIADPNNPLFTRARKLGLPLVHRERIPSTRRAHACTEFARAQGKLEPFHAAVIAAYWSRGEDISDWVVLRAAATSAGLDPDAMQAEVEAGKWTEEVEAGVAAARELGIHSVPTFVVGGRYAIQGAQEARVFRQAFERLQSGL
jgi:predicted DsbA family dithiol-disulfide isomerase